MSTRQSDLKRIKKIRAFNRFYTKKFGLITKRFLESDYSLIQARILFELDKSTTLFAKDLVKEIEIDPTYLSKILKKFEKDGLLSKKISSRDSRKLVLSLTKDGKKAYSYLRKMSNKQIESLIQSLSEEKKRILVDSMEAIEKILGFNKMVSEIFVIRSHRPGDIGYIVYRHGVLYGQEYGFNAQFDGYVAKGLAIFIENFNPLKEHLWIAEMRGTIIGSVAIVQLEDELAQLRWLIVESTERGKGIGKKLINEATHFARINGYKKIILWTIDFLHAARKLYSDANFKLVETKKSQVWGKELIEEKWELLL